MARAPNMGNKASKARRQKKTDPKRTKSLGPSGTSSADIRKQLKLRTSELNDALEQQKATAELLRVISSSPGKLEPVFETMLENAKRLCDAKFIALYLHEGGTIRQVAARDVPPAFAEAHRRGPIVPAPDTALGGVIRTKQSFHLADLAATRSYADRHPSTVQGVELGGVRTLVAVPLLKDIELIGIVIIFRQEVRPFSDRQINLLENFATQVAIAIANVELFKVVQERTGELSQSLDDLRSAQDRLIQTEKLASLGQLTAGIAHEIKNPLNFVNNFSTLSAELIDELDETLGSASLDPNLRADVGQLTRMLKSNLEKVVQHGKRADSIVKNMLLHSREGSGERRSASINGLVEESLNLAYHGARAEKADFNITFKHDLDPNAGAVDLYPQEITRALLNLISNGFYAAIKRKAETGDEAFEPVLSAATRSHGKTVEIRIRDNGAGIPPDVREKMFNPFFTTKPTGEGTGLGLSMAHDIIVKQHGGKIDFETKPGEFTEFIITLPRGRSTADG
jgi:signal transduction histidine kinase